MRDPGPVSIAGLGPRAIGPYLLCDLCLLPTVIPTLCVPPQGTWACYGPQALCLRHAQLALDAFGSSV